MVGCHHDGGVIPAAMRVEMVEDAAKLGVAQPHQRRVIGTKLGHLLRRLVDPLVAWPVKHRPRIAGVPVAVPCRRVKGLMRIEGFHLQKPAVGSGVLVKEGQRRINAAYHWKIGLAAQPCAVDHALKPVAVTVVLELQRMILRAEPFHRRLHHRRPGV